VNPWHVLYYAALVPAVLAVFFRSPFAGGSLSSLRRKTAAEARHVSRTSQPTGALRSSRPESKAATTQAQRQRVAQGRQATIYPTTHDDVPEPGGRTLAPPASRPAAVQEHATEDGIPCWCGPDRQCALCGALGPCLDPDRPEIVIHREDS
jgi:hypothetical protein